MMTKEEAYKSGFEDGFEMARESGSAEAGSDGWDGMLINAHPSFARENLGWDGSDSTDEAKELMAEYCRGAQDGANQAVAERNGADDLATGFAPATASAQSFLETCPAVKAIRETDEGLEFDYDSSVEVTFCPESLGIKW